MTNHTSRTVDLDPVTERVLRVCKWQAHLARTEVMKTGLDFHKGYKIACEVIAQAIARGEDAPVVPTPCCGKEACKRE